MSTALFLTRADADWPHGLRCISCDTPIIVGEPYTKRLVAMNDESPVVELVCVRCALRPAEER